MLKKIKKAKKSKPKHIGDTFSMPMEPKPETSKNVQLKKAKNGYVVSSYHNGEEHVYIAKSHADATKHATKLLKIGKQ